MGTFDHSGVSRLLRHTTIACMNSTLQRGEQERGFVNLFPMKPLCHETIASGRRSPRLLLLLLRQGRRGSRPRGGRGRRTTQRPSMRFCGVNNVRLLAINKIVFPCSQGVATKGRLSTATTSTIYDEEDVRVPNSRTV